MSKRSTKNNNIAKSDAYKRDELSPPHKSLEDLYSIHHMRYLCDQVSKNEIFLKYKNKVNTTTRHW